MSRRVRWLLTILCLVFLACALPAHRAGFTIAWRPLLVQAGIVLLLVATRHVYARLERAPRLQSTLEVSAFSIVLSSSFTFAMHVALRHGSGFADASLTRLDAALGIDVPALVHFSAAHPRIDQVLGAVYESLRAVSVLALLLSALAGRAEWACELLVSLAICAVLSLLVLVRVRAVGPWVFGEFTPSHAQASCEAALRAIDRGAPLVIDVTRSAPLIAFPSWHVMLCVLAAVTIGKFRYAAVPALCWAVLVSLSTLTTGWHYAVDVLEGVLLAAVAIAVAKVLLRLPAFELGSTLSPRTSEK